MDKSRSSRKVSVTDRIWDTFEQMADEMGSDRDGLVNQAMYMFARLNGFLTPGQDSVPEDRSPVKESVRSRGSSSGEPRMGMDPLEESSSLDDEPDVPAAKAPSGRKGGSASRESGRRRRIEEKVLETAAQLERQIKGRGPQEPPDIDDLLDDDVGDDLLDDDELVDELMGDVEEKSLYLMTSDGELDKVAKSRFLIGRGKHCDFVVQSGKVSREHAVISSEPDGYFIEDLGSSNGTWFQKQRIKRREIEDGDEYYICSEKIKCVIR